jgi:hypothetical protein
MLQAGRSRVRFPMGSLNVSIDLILQPHYGPGVDSASNRNEYQESSWGAKGGRRVRLTTSPSSVSRLCRKSWQPRRLTTLWASTACYRDRLRFRSPTYHDSCAESQDSLFIVSTKLSVRWSSTSWRCIRELEVKSHAFVTWARVI